MKPFVLFAAALLPAAVMAQKGEVTLKGRITSVTPPVKKVVVNFRSGAETVRDTIQVDNGSFKYKHPLVEPLQARVTYVSEKPIEGSTTPMTSVYAFPVFLEPGASISIDTRDSVKHHVVKGSKVHAEWEKVSAQAKPYEEQQAALYAAFDKANKAGDKAAASRFEHQADSLDEVISDKVWGAYLDQHTNSPLALYALRQYAGYYMDAAKVGPVYARLPESVKATPSGKAFAEELETARKTAIGSIAMDFTQNDTLDNPVRLSSFRGKYLLVDFWASWCGPCRRENPNVVAAFNQYKDKNFTILGVSLDRPGQKEAWLKAIHKDGLTWNHVSDLKWWENEVAKQYGIRAIPANLLLDPEGKIIARNLSGEALQQKLAEVLR